MLYRLRFQKQGSKATIPRADFRSWEEKLLPESCKSGEISLIVINFDFPNLNYWPTLSRQSLSSDLLGKKL